jgi:E3 ubiquitin-protein ligase BAH
MFDPVSLSCGHIFCYLCCCSAASVTPVDVQQGVFSDAMHLDALNMLLRHR